MAVMINSEKVKERRKHLGLSQNELARIVGVTQPFIVKIEKNGANSTTYINQIARALETSAEYLTDETNDPSEHYIPRPSPKDLRENLDAVAITELDLSLGMGGMAIFDHEIEQKQLLFSRAWIKGFTDSAPSKLFVVRGMGDSMNPTIQDNDICLVDTSQTNPTISDKIWAITHYGGGQIKRLRHYQEGFKIMSDNPNISDEIAMDGEMHVIGRVVGIMRRV